MEFAVEYIKDMYSNYMILIPVDGNGYKTDTYARKMLTENDISGLLTCEIRTYDMVEKYYYNISSKQPIINVFEKGQIDEIQTSKLIGNIMLAIKEAKKYMLSEEDFVLTPEYVYMNMSNFEVGLCYFPGYNKSVKEQLSGVLEFLLERVNHNNQKAIVMAYGLYKLIRGDEVSFDNIEEFMNRTLNQEDASLLHNEQCDREPEFESAGNDYITNMIGDNGDEDEYDAEKENTNGLLYDNKERGEGKNISDSKMIGLAVGVYVVVMAGVYLCLSKGGRINVGLLLCIGFTLLCATIAIVMLIRQNIIYKVKEETLCKVQENEVVYDEENYWQEEYTALEDDRTVLLTQQKSITGFELIGEDGERIKIKEFPFVIGKLKEKVSYCINDVTISRLHAKLDEYDEDTLLLTDLNSTNGTYVGEKKLKSNEVVKINMHETITLGNYSFVLIKE